MKPLLFFLSILFCVSAAAQDDCSPSIYFLFDAAADSALACLNKNEISDQIVLLVNKTAYSKDKKARTKAEKLFEQLPADSMTPVLRAYQGALEAIQIRDMAFAKKFFTWIASGFSSKSMKAKVRSAIELICQTVEENPDDIIVRFVRVAIGAEALIMMPDSMYFSIVLADLKRLQESTEISAAYQQFFLHLYWVKYFYALADSQDDGRPLAQARDHLSMADSFACMEFYRSETANWRKRLAKSEKKLN